MTAVSVSEVAVDGTGDFPLPSTRPKSGLRGAMLNIPYVGRVQTTATAAYDANPTLVHPTYATVAIGAGGAPVSTGYRDDDSYSPTGGEVEDSGLSSADGAGQHTQTRPSGRPGYIADGVPGGSAVSDIDSGGTQAGEVIDVAGRAQSTGKDRFGRTKGVANAGAGLGDLVYTNFDRRSTLSGDGGYALGNAGRGVQIDPDAVGSNVNHVVPRVTIDTTATGGGVVGIGTGSGGLVTVALHANDITDAGSPTIAGAAGAQVAIFKADTGDTTENGQLVGLFDCDAGTTTATVASGLGGVAVRIYARSRYRVNRYIAKRTGPGATNQAAVATGVTAYGYGPWSEVTTATVTA